MKRIPVSPNRYAFVDDSDYVRVMEHRWCFNQGYAQTNLCDGEGFHTTVKMERYIMGLPPIDGLVVDHKNHDKLDNRRDNLRWVTPSINSHNRAVSKGYFLRKDGLYQVYVSRKYIGVYKTAVLARIAYLQAKKKIDPISYQQILKHAAAKALLVFVCVFLLPPTRARAHTQLPLSPDIHVAVRGLA